MALSPAQKEKLKDLELERGGVAFVSEKSSVTPNPTIVISLGGLGGKTLNALKGKFIREIGESDHVWFRMIDTSAKDMDDQCKVKSDGSVNLSSNAHLEQNEAISLYVSSIAHILAESQIPFNIKKWINSELIGTLIDNTGAQQIRQIGRAMLTNGVVYPSVKTKLNTVVLDAISKIPQGGNVDVIILAGISGGTGSGTIIDTSYMIHDLFREAGCTKYRVAGYIYTPDVQFGVQGIAGNPAIKQNLQKNGYAALKEIDYFMNIEETKSVYRLELDSSEVVSQKNIFSSCTLISGYAAEGGMNDVSHTIGRVTDQLMDMLTDISITQGGASVQMSSSILSNEHAMLSAWFSGHPARKNYHRYASYKYQVLGYSSIVIPRDEILAYCVNKIYERVLREFKNLSLVNKDMMRAVYERTNIIAVEPFTAYACRVNPNNVVNNDIYLDPIYTKAMIKQNPMVAYEDAKAEAETEKAKINAGFQQLLEQSLVRMLKEQVDQIFAAYGPFVALKAIEHKHTEVLTDTPSDPFPGIIEQLQLLANQFIDRANQANAVYDRQAINNAADSATGIFASQTARQDYINLCCDMAVSTVLETHLYSMIADSLTNVAAAMADYNNELFEVYTSILSEVQKLLNKDGQYFTEGRTTQQGNRTTFSVDIIMSGEGKARKLEKYLNSFIDQVSVKELADNFIKQMRDNKDRWLAQNNENDFDVVGEVRALMDACLTNNDMKNEIIEKFITVAYCPNDLTPQTLNEIWNDDDPNGPKMQALKSAANEIYTRLMHEAQPMANTTRIDLSEFSEHFFITTLAETPNIANILGQRVQAMQGITPATSNSNNKFIVTKQYMSVPMYVLLGMKDYNQVYVDHPSAGRHMDEKEQNWGRFPNPYTIDSVALDIAQDGKPAQDIEKYPDYQFLLTVKAQAEAAIAKYKFVEVVSDGTGLVKLVLHDVASKPANMDEFKENLYQELLSKRGDVDVLAFMRENGFIFTEVEVAKGSTDVDLMLLDFAKAPESDMEGKYKDVPVRIPDVYKWLRKSIKYMDILEKDTAIFEELYAIVDDAKEAIERMKKYITDTEIFAFALRTGLVKQDEANENIWKFTDVDEPVSINFARSKAFDKDYFLYHLFVKFAEMSNEGLEAMKGQAERLIDEGKEVDLSAIKSRIDAILSIDELGDVHKESKINKTAAEQGVAENYVVTDKIEDKGNPVRVLKRFYELVKTSL